MRKYLALICFVRFEDHIRSFFSRDRALILSWKNTTYSSARSYPWHLIKYPFQTISVNLSPRLISSVLVELFVFCFVLVDELHIAPFPKVTSEPIFPRQSLWIWCDPLTYQCTANLSWSAWRISFKCFVSFRYLRRRFNFPQPSSSSALKLS